jgi:hypothetical protein
MPASKAQQAITAERRAKALALKVAGVSYEQIAGQLQYADRASAYKDIERALKQRKKDQDGAADLAVSLELERLDAMERAVWAVLRRQHVLVSGGKVVKDDSGRTMVDDAPTLAAIDRLVKIQERRARYLGLDAPQRHEVSLDEIERQIRELATELGETEAGAASGTAPPAPDQG